LVDDIRYLSLLFTHPVIASLDHPLFACGGKRELKNFPNPLFRVAEERVAQQSVGGVSSRRYAKLIQRQYKQKRP